MKKIKSWITLTLVFYLIFLLWTLPAQYVLAFLEERNVLPEGVIPVSGVEGAWTCGRSLRVKAGETVLNDLSWRFQPSGLISGRLQFALTSGFADGTASGILSVGYSRVELKKIRGQIPAASLGQIYLPGVELSGTLEMEDLSLIAKDGYLIGGSGELVWRNAKVNSPYRMSLGGVMLDLETQDDGIEFKLNDLGGGLQASGLGLLTSQGKYSFDGTVGTRQGSSPELATFLQILGNPGAGGMVEIGFKGQVARFF